MDSDNRLTLCFPDGKTLQLEPAVYNQWQFLKTIVEDCNEQVVHIVKYYKILRHVLKTNDFYFRHPNQLNRVFLTLTYYGNDELLDRLKYQTIRKIWDFYDLEYQDRPELQSNMELRRAEERASQNPETWGSFRLVRPEKKSFNHWHKCVSTAITWYKSMDFPSFCNEWFYEDLHDMF